MDHYLDLSAWPRRELFEFFAGYSNPYFNICARLNIARLAALIRQRSGVRISLALHYFALRIANEIEPFRYRLREQQIFVYDIINGGTTVLRPDETFGFAYFQYHEHFERFVSEAAKSVDQVKAESDLRPAMRDDLIYFTSLPWISFSSFAHARNRGRGDSVPRIVFGKFIKKSDDLMLPISVEVHHALMDGLHVGRFLTRFEEALAAPETFLDQRDS